MANNMYMLLAFATTALLIPISFCEINPAQEEESNRSKLQDQIIASSAANNEVKNVSLVNPLEYAIKLTMENRGTSSAKVQQRYLFPDGVEVKAFNLQDDGHRARRSADNQRLTQWAGGMVNLKPSDHKEADMTYVNHPAEVINPYSKTFHKLSTTILIKAGDLVGGVITSPNYPFRYPNGADLTWLIAYPENNIVKLQIDDYATEECCDHLMIYDGYNVSHHPLATFEGEYYAGDSNIVYSTSPAMFIRFTSDCLSTSRGFQATYVNVPSAGPPSMSCGSVLTNGNSGNVQSPNYPGTYDKNMNCTWNIQTYYTTRVKFVLDDFYVGYDDAVEIYDGTPNNPGYKIAWLSGSYYSGYTIYGSSYQAFVVFSSGTSASSSNKFLISYSGEYTAPETTAIPSVSCGYVYYTGSYDGIINSPNYPGTYPSNMNCTWAVTTEYGTKVTFHVQSFYLASGDFLYVVDGTPNDPGRFVKYMSGYYNANYTISTDSNRAFLWFFSDSYSQNSVYKFRFSFDGTASEVTTYPTTTYYNPPQCDGTAVYLSYTSGHIYTPGYYSPSYYPMNQYCIWYFTTSSSYTIRIYPHYFSTEYGYDFVRIYNGYSTESSNILSQISGYVDPYTTLAVSSSPYATLTFSSDDIVTDRGFEIHYYQYYSGSTETSSGSGSGSDPNACSPTYYGSYSGYLKSPNYPYNYDNNLNCSTIVVTPDGTNVKLMLQSFSVSYGDYLRVYDGFNGNLLASFSGYYSYDYVWEASTNYITLVFTTDYQYTSYGYYIQYDAIYEDDYPSPYNCGTEITGDHATISSPNYPNNYNDNLRCLWTVDVSPLERYTLFTVDNFNTEYSYDYVDFYGGTPSNSTAILAQLTGPVASGTEILIQDSQAFVTFRTDGSVTSSGFEIRYKAVPTYYVARNLAVMGINQPDTEVHPSWSRDKTQTGPVMLGRDIWKGAKNRSGKSLRKMQERKNQKQNEETSN